MSRAKLPSGRFVLRLPPALHAQLAASAQAGGISLNEHCQRVLAHAEVGAVAAPGAAQPFTGVIAKGIAQLGPDLRAVALFGSVARGEAVADSDVDVLFVVAPEVAITRALYAPWDDAGLRIDARRVEPHFVRMRSRDDEISGFWAEVALDAAVLYDPALELTPELARIRRAILSGELVRRTAGGHSWWSAA